MVHIADKVRKLMELIGDDFSEFIVKETGMHVLVVYGKKVYILMGNNQSGHTTELMDLGGKILQAGFKKPIHIWPQGLAELLLTHGATYRLTEQTGHLIRNSYFRRDNEMPYPMPWSSRITKVLAEAGFEVEQVDADSSN